MLAGLLEGANRLVGTVARDRHLGQPDHGPDQPEPVPQLLEHGAAAGQVGGRGLDVPLVQREMPGYAAPRGRDPGIAMLWDVPQLLVRTLGISADEPQHRRRHREQRMVGFFGQRQPAQHPERLSWVPGGVVHGLGHGRDDQADRILLGQAVRRRVPGYPQHLRRPLACLRVEVAQDPEPSQRAEEAQRRSRVRRRDHVAQRGGEVVVLGREQIQPDELVPGAQSRLRPLGQVEEVVRVRGGDEVGLAGLGQPVGRVRAHGLQQPVPHVPVASGGDQRLVHQ